MVDEHVNEDAPDSSRAAARDRILDAAEELFGSRGFDAVSVSEIAAAAGVSTALIYYHFEDKESLLGDILHRASQVFEPLQAELRTGPGSARNRLEAYIDAWVSAVLEHQNLVRILIRPVMDPGGPLGSEILGGVSRHMEALVATISEGMDQGEFVPGDPVLAAECLFALLNTRVAAGALNADHLKSVDSDAHDVARFISDVFLRGLSVNCEGGETC